MTMSTQDWTSDLLHVGPNDRGRGTGQSCLVVRTGGLGDILFATPVIRLYAEMGFLVSMYTNREPGEIIVRHNPFLRSVITRMDVPWDANLFHDLQKHHHLVVNLQCSLEGQVSFHTEDPKYYMNHWQRQTRVDYAEATLTAGAIANPERKLLIPEIYQSDLEVEWGDQWAARHKEAGQQTILWNPLGSSLNKHVLQSPDMMRWVLREFPETKIYVIGDHVVHDHPILAGPLLKVRDEYPERFQVVASRRGDRGTWSLRKTLIALGRANLFVGPESGLAVGAGAADTPKIIFWSASAPYNVSNAWLNVYSVHNSAPCSPCYRIPHRPEDHPECTVMGPKGEFTGAYCMNGINQESFRAAVRSVLAGRPDRTCPLCGSSDTRELGDRWFICTCLSVFSSAAETAPSVEEELSTIVGDGVRQARIEFVTRFYLHMIEKEWRNGQKGFFFDVGAGIGTAVRAAQAFGWRAAGIEQHTKVPSYPWLTKGDYCNDGACSQGSDVLWMSHVLHTAADPVGMFTRAAGSVAPDGTLVVNTPNTLAVGFRAYLSGSPNRVFPSFRFLTRLAEENGFAPVKLLLNSGQRESGHPYIDDLWAFFRRKVPVPSVESLSEPVHA